MIDEPDEFIPTRTSLLERLKRWDDQESWRDFFNTYWRLIYGAAVKAGLSDAEAQEAVQETVIIVSKKMEDFKYDPAASRSSPTKASALFLQRGAYRPGDRIPAGSSAFFSRCQTAA